MLDLRISHDDQIWTILTHDIERLNRIRKKAAKFIHTVQEKQKEPQQENRKWKIGDQVLLYRNIVESSWSMKLELRWEGPYFIANIKGTSIWLQKPQGTILHTPVHQSKIKTYHARH